MATALVLFALLPLCTGTPASLSSLRSVAFGGGAGTGAGAGRRGSMGFPRTMMDMAAQMMRMAASSSQAARQAPHTPGGGQVLLDTAASAGNLGQHLNAGWGAPLPRPPHGLGAFMDVLPPPPAHPLPQGAAPQLGELMGGAFVGEHLPMGRPPHTRGKFAGEMPPGGGFGAGDAFLPPPRSPGGSSQLHLMEKLHGPPKGSAVVTTTGQSVAPVGVGADFSFFAGKLAGGGGAGGGGNGSHGPNPLDQHAVPIADIGHLQVDAHAHGAGSQPAKDLHYHDVMAPSSPKPNPAKDVATGGAGQGPGQKKQRAQDPNLHAPTPPPPLHHGPPTAEQLLMSNLFAMGSGNNKGAGDHVKQVVPEPLVTASKSAGMGPIPGLTVPLHDSLTPASNTADMALRAPCDLNVDAVFALDDMKNLWLARESIRYYETQLLPSRKTRFGVVLCGQHKSFYTALHQHFSALLASLEDLEHANATLEPAQHMPDTPGHRSENNPYPPRVSEDFAQIDAGCMEAAYHLLTFQSPPGVDRLLTVVGTKERWANKVSVDEAHFLHSLNISLLTTADGQLSPAAHDSLRKMASSPDKFRSVGDSVTLHALPGMIGSAICRPQKADVTVAIHRTATSIIQEPVVKECHQVNPMTMQRTVDFGQFFGLHTDHVRCPPGLLPDLRLCACV